MQPGYNPNSSLLPVGGGPIVAMSGGGAGQPPMPTYNAGASLLPPPPAHSQIQPFTGGFFEEEIRIVGGDPPPAPPTPPTPPAVTASAPVTIMPEKPAETNTKDIILFGQSLKLEDPKKTPGANLTETQTRALALFGLDGPGLSSMQKKDVLQALYDGKCNTDKPLIFQIDCEPMRRIVQSLALNLLNKIKTNEAAGTENEGGNPKVTAEKREDGTFRVYIDFTPAQLPLLSKYKVDEFVQSKRANRNKKAPPTTTSSVTEPSSDAQPSPSRPATGEETIETIKIEPKEITGGGSDVVTTLGITNPNIWCYAIAAIQFMFSVPQIRDTFSKFKCENTSLSIPSGKGFDTAINGLTEIKDNDALCALKWILGELSQSTTKFTDTNFASKFNNSVIPVNIPVLYIMKKFLLMQMLTDKNSTGSIKEQQDVAEFLRIIFDIIDKDKSIKSVLNNFKYTTTKKYTCEITDIKKADSPPITDNVILPLYAAEYAGDKAQELVNQKKDINTNGISVQNLINYYSRNRTEFESSTSTVREQVVGCGPGGGKGDYTYREDISIPDGNTFLILNILKSSDPNRPFNGPKIKAEAEITVGGQRYTIFGATLYEGTGMGGHYMYQRLYADGTADISSVSDVNTLPYVMYNTGNTSVNKSQGFSILNNATVLIYKRVSEAGSKRAPNLKCQAIIRNWLDGVVTDKGSITAEEKGMILGKGVTEDELNACLEYFRDEGENIAFAPAEPTEIAVEGSVLEAGPEASEEPPGVISEAEAEEAEAPPTAEQTIEEFMNEQLTGDEKSSKRILSARKAEILDATGTRFNRDAIQKYLDDNGFTEAGGAAAAVASAEEASASRPAETQEQQAETGARPTAESSTSVGQPNQSGAAGAPKINPRNFNNLGKAREAAATAAAVNKRNKGKPLSQSEKNLVKKHNEEEQRKKEDTKTLRRAEEYAKAQKSKTNAAIAQLDNAIEKNKKLSAEYSAIIANPKTPIKDKNRTRLLLANLQTLLRKLETEKAKIVEPTNEELEEELRKAQAEAGRDTAAIGGGKKQKRKQKTKTFKKSNLKATRAKKQKTRTFKKRK